MAGVLELLRDRRQGRGMETSFLDRWLSQGGLGSGFLADEASGFLDERRAQNDGHLFPNIRTAFQPGEDGAASPFRQWRTDNSNALIGAGTALLNGGRNAWGNAGQGFLAGRQMDDQAAERRRQEQEQQQQQAALNALIAGAPAEAIPTLEGLVAAGYGDAAAGYMANTLVPQGQDGLFGPIVTGDEAAALGLDPTRAWQIGPDLQWHQAGGTGDTFYIGDQQPTEEELLRRGLTEAEIGTWSTFVEQEAQVASRFQDLEVLAELATVAPGGPLTGRLLELVGSGFNTAADAMTSIIMRLAPTFRVEGSGSTSDIEYQGMLNSLPRLRETPEGRMAVIMIMQEKAAIDLERARIVHAFQNGEIDLRTARTQLAELNTRSIITDEYRALVGIPLRTEDALRAPGADAQQGGTPPDGRYNILGP